jgi:2-keto-4-pentenoate hydratase
VSDPTAHEQAARSRRSFTEESQHERASIVGIKVALTSPAAQARVGTDGPIWGWLTDRMQIASGGVIQADPELAARAEAELVFVLGRDLIGPHVSSRDVLAATAALCGGIELPARYVGDPPSAADLISRNALANRFVVGDPVPRFDHLDLALLGVVIEINGEPTHSGSAANAMGHPAEAVAAVVNDPDLIEAGGLRAGQLIFSGSLTPAITLSAGITLDANFAHLGRVGITVAPHIPRTGAR